MAFHFFKCWFCKTKNHETELKLWFIHFLSSENKTFKFILFTLQLHFVASFFSAYGKNPFNIYFQSVLELFFVLSVFVYLCIVNLRLNKTCFIELCCKLEFWPFFEFCPSNFSLNQILSYHKTFHWHVSFLNYQLVSFSSLFHSEWFESFFVSLSFTSFGKSAQIVNFVCQILFKRLWFSAGNYENLKAFDLIVFSWFIEHESTVPTKLFSIQNKCRESNKFRSQRLKVLIKNP